MPVSGQYRRFPMSKVRLRDTGKVFRGSIANTAGELVYVRGNAVVEVPDPMPQDVLDSVKGGMLMLTDEYPHPNTLAPLRPQAKLPPLVPSYRSPAHAAIPNGDVSTTRNGGTNEDAINP